MEAKIIMTDDRRAKISINGVIVEPTGFMTYNTFSGQFIKQREIGAPIYFFSANIADQGINSFAGMHPTSPSFFVGENQYDFSHVERSLNEVAPDGSEVYLIPRVQVSAPKWWQDAHPEELCRDNRGDDFRESFASKKWREDMWTALKALIDYINSSKWKDRVIGYHICAGATEEWTYFCKKMGTEDYLDYSQVNLDYFKEWLKNKYSNLKALNSAWNSSLKSFEQVDVPRVAQRKWAYNGILRNLSREQAVVDYFEYGSWLFADTINWFGRKVKEYTDNKLLTGIFYGYTTILSAIDKCHYALHNVLTSPYIDFIATTNGGQDVWPFGSAVDSVRLHNKLFICEGDVRTCLTKTLDKTMPWAVPDNNYYTNPELWVGPKDVETSVADLKRSSARVLAGYTGIWWFDMFGGVFDNEQMMQVIKRHKYLSAAQTAGPINTEVALIIDENGLKYFKRNHPALDCAVQRQRKELGVSGAPYHIYLADDIADENFPVDDYKLYVFVQLCNPTEKVKNAINNKLKSGNRTLLWTYFAGINNKELTDFEVTYNSDLPDAQCEFSQTDFPSYRACYLYDRKETPFLYPYMEVPCPRFAEGEKDKAYIMAKLKGSNEPALLWKNCDGYSSVYSLLPEISYQVLREIIYMSNAHVFSLTGDVLIAGGRFIALRSRTAGEKRICLPFPVSKVIDTDTGKEVALNDLYIDFEMEADRTRMFYIEK